MTNQQHPAQFDWATELLDAEGHVTLSKQEAHEIGARLRRLHVENEALRAERERNLNSIRVNNEIINKKNAELESLTTGYAAARLEIESLQARIKAMAEDHADELMVAHLDGRMRVAQPAGVQQPGAHGAIMSAAYDFRDAHLTGSIEQKHRAHTALVFAVYNALRASHGQAPAQAAHQPAATPQADSQPAPDEATAMSRTGDLAEAGRWPSDWVEAYRRGYSDRASRAPADSVLEDAARLEQRSQPSESEGMTIAGNGASELGKLMREQRALRGGFYPDGNPNTARKQGANHD